DRTQCTNNLKQLGLALHAYSDSFESLPPAGKSYGWCQTKGAGADNVVQNLNGLTLLLPYLEQEALYHQFNMAGAFSNYLGAAYAGSVNNPPGGLASPDAQASGNGKLSSISLPIFLCPSDGGKKYFTQPNNAPYVPYTGGGLTPAKTSYEFVVSFTDLSS